MVQPVRSSAFGNLPKLCDETAEEAASHSRALGLGFVWLRVAAYLWLKRTVARG